MTSLIQYKFFVSNVNAHPGMLTDVPTEGYVYAADDENAKQLVCTQHGVSMDQVRVVKTPLNDRTKIG